jgi:hypothetical protein
MASVTAPVTYTVSTTATQYVTTGGGFGGAGSPYTFNTGAGNVILNGGSSWGTINTAGSNLTGASLHVSHDAEFEGDIKVKGKSLSEWMATMEKRLAILVPDPTKLEKFEALQKAYNHYKLLEALCHEEKSND